jgi:hypothetical protein
MPQQQAPAKPKPNFNIQNELDNRTFIKPLKGKGKLLSGNILYAPIDTFQDITYSFKALAHAAKGKANDHELGKLNDLGMMAGGLSIAGYLFTKKSTPLTKGMEFVGLGSFFASMALWPKIAIQLPAYLIHGVNVQKQYQDSFGRRKPFYQDPQFIPWDLYSDKEIDKIGNRLGVPKNIPNRRDFIQEKMRKLAVQNNTLWMLTAGFATPIMSALICNQAEPYLLKYQNNQKNKQADQILRNLDTYSKKYQTNPVNNTLTEIIKKHGNQPINDELFETITEAFTRDVDPVTSESLKKDLQTLLSDRKYSINDDTAKNVVLDLKKYLENASFSKEFIENVVPKDNEMVELFKNNGFTGNNFLQVEHTEINNKIVEYLIQKADVFNNNFPDMSEDLDDFREILNSNIRSEHPIEKALGEVKATVLDEALQGKLKSIATVLDNFRAKNLALDEYALIKVGSAPETVIANFWNESSQDLMKSLGFTDAEIEKVRFNRDLMGGVLRDKLEHIASDKKSYDKVMEVLVKKVVKLNSEINPNDLASHMLNDTTKTTYDKEVETLFNQFASSLKENGLGRTAQAIIGVNGNDNGSYIKIQKAYVEDRLLGVKSAFNRLINTFDLYRRVATDPNALTHINPECSLVREVKEELIELCKIITLSGHSSDFATKFWMRRNPNPSADTSKLEVEGGKIKNKYFGHSAGTADISTDKYFYQNAMKFMFQDDIHPDTKAILESNPAIKDEFVKYRQLVVEKLGGEHYFAKPRHKISNSAPVGSDIKFLLTGIAPDEFFFKAGQQAFNTKKWLKMFGGFGIGLLGVTVLAQFFLGRLKAPRQVNNDKLN